MEVRSRKRQNGQKTPGVGADTHTIASCRASRAPPSRPSIWKVYNPRHKTHSHARKPPGSLLASVQRSETQAPPSPSEVRYHSHHHRDRSMRERITIGDKILDSVKHTIGTDFQCANERSKIRDRRKTTPAARPPIQAQVTAGAWDTLKSLDFAALTHRPG